MDDLLDLNWSSTPPSSSSPAAGPSKTAPTIQPKPTHLVSSFDLLSRPSPSLQPNYASSSTSSSFPSRTASPLPPALSVRLAPNLAKASSSSNSPAASPNPASSGLDAFSGLLSLSGGGGVDSSKTLSLADRQKQLAEQKRRAEEEDRARFDHGDFWDKFGASGSTQQLKPTPLSQPKVEIPRPGSAALPALSVSRPGSTNPERAKSPLGTISNANVQSGSIDDDDDDFGLLALPSSSRPPANGSTSSQPIQSLDPFDFDQLSASVPSAPFREKSSGMRTPVSNFDFNERDGTEDEDDILGQLAQPAPKRISKSPERTQSPRKPQRPGRPASPPPHIVGQIVEMGFSPAQARQALASTSTGLDVQAAIESLVSSRPGSARPDDLSEDEDFVSRERQRREEEEAERRRRRRAGPSRDAVKPRSRGEQARDERTPAHAGEYDTDRIIAQASELGQNMLSKATSFWNTSKERALKAYEEQKKAMEASAAANGGERRRPVKDGRPRWMVEAEEAEKWDQPAPSRAPRNEFKDSDDEEDRPRLVPRRAQRDRANEANGAASTAPARDEQSPNLDRYRSVKERADLLFAEETPVYKSAARHRQPARNGVTLPSRPASTPAPAVSLVTRQLVPASPSQLQQCASKKSQGNEHFKLGRFTEAEAAYTAAIASLPEGHLLLVPLYNNRAATHLKLGQSSSAVSDCSAVVDIVGISYHPSKETPLPTELAEVKLGDALVKAMVKRAQAWEMGEKWKSALEDWERVMGFDIALLGSTAQATRNMAATGAARARKMLEGPPSPTNKIESRPKPKPKPPLARVATPLDSAAVSSLRKANAAQAAEDEQRLALKDSVDAKLQAWKGGKETNLRALIASLDTVLWDEILAGGLKVGMHELISEKQVKIKYMKVIARLHPDKLNTTNTTVEQRMLANGAFGTLNEAWQAFQNA